MTPIENYETYNTEMSKVMFDKLFFLSKVDADIFVDFGCADGAMIHNMSKMFPEHIYIGYDTDESMIEISNKNNAHAFTEFTNSWLSILNQIKTYQYQIGRKAKTCLILSSVIHEIYSYEDKHGIEVFWDRVFNSGFDYVVIRDMGIDHNIKHESYVDISNLKDKFDQKQLADFETIWGPVENRHNLMHFLLKYRYTANWEREVRENYFSYNINSVWIKAIDAGYKQTHFDHFSVPFIRRQIQNDFDWIMNEPTHYKMILEKAK